MTLIDKLTKQLARLPSIGERSAKRISLHILENQQALLEPLVQILLEVADKIVTCSQCGNLDEINPCHICRDPLRSQDILCVVANVGDLWAVERSRGFHGKYYILGGLLSTKYHNSQQQQRLQLLQQKLQNNQLKEIVIATNLTADGQTTAFYIAKLSQQVGLEATRLAHGIPAAGELEYMDDETISAALLSRQSLS